MKTIKTFKLITLFSLLIVFFSCSKETSMIEEDSNITEEDLNTNNISQDTYNYSGTANSETLQLQPEDSVFLKEEAKNGMISFVNSISIYYNDGDTYQEFKYKIDPNNSLSSITNQGESLLTQAYNYLKNDIPESEFEGKEMMLSLKYILEQNIDAGIENPDNVDLEAGGRQLFGISSNFESNDSITPPVTSFSAPCNGFWDFGCHMGNAWNWLKENADTLLTIAKIIIVVLS